LPGSVAISIILPPRTPRLKCASPPRAPTVFYCECATKRWIFPSSGNRHRALPWGYKHVSHSSYIVGRLSSIYTSARAALDSPALFSDLILIDPVTYCPSSFDAIAAEALPLSTTVGRRVEFPSRCVGLLSCKTGLTSSYRAAALESFLKVPFFSRWDKRVLRAYVDFGMTEDEVNGGVRLKTSGYQVSHNHLHIYAISLDYPPKEAAVFAERRIAMEVYELLAQLDDRIELRWIMAGRENGL